MTGLRRTPQRKRSGCWPTRFPVRKPPCEPPITATLALSTRPEKVIDTEDSGSCDEPEQITLPAEYNAIEGVEASVV